MCTFNRPHPEPPATLPCGIGLVANDPGFGLYVFEHSGELGNAHSHSLFDCLVVGRQGDADAPARDFGAYSVSFDGKALSVGETVEAAPGVKLTRRC